MAAPAQPIESPFRRRARGVTRVFGPIREARGFARVMLYIGAAITLLFVVLAIFAPLISPYDFDQYQSGNKRFPQLAGPSSKHLMGTTVQSTDVLSRVIWGAQTELKVVIISLVFAITLGVPLGLLSGYFGGKLDRGLVLVMDALYAFPYL
jgi:peptide/nickel transport system permease protein